MGEVSLFDALETVLGVLHMCETTCGRQPGRHEGCQCPHCFRSLRKTGSSSEIFVPMELSMWIRIYGTSWITSLEASDVYWKILSGSGFWERTVSGDLENSHQNPPTSLACYAIWGKIPHFLNIMRLWRMPCLVQKGDLRSKWANSLETSGLKSNPKHRANLKDY